MEKCFRYFQSETSQDEMRTSDRKRDVFRQRTVRRFSTRFWLWRESEVAEVQPRESDTSFRLRCDRLFIFSWFWSASQITLGCSSMLMFHKGGCSLHTAANAQQSSQISSFELTYGKEVPREKYTLMFSNAPLFPN